ncbi:MAG: 50S ribosomal protein L18 [Euryarchaeota archaeon]|nr:50S ribosomal protein L18 [Euryarchaeota archaeon]MEC7703668.1 50S ribosomal protein L18 [Candidatus Thermoplasmatota archaeon]
MAQGRRQRRRYKRRSTGQTDYHRRLKLLRGETPRAVVRVTNTQVICQLVEYESNGDKVLSVVDGKSLRSKYGWPSDASAKSVPAAYCTGYALAKQVQKAGHDEAVLDIGLAASTPGNRVFAALKGMIDGGLWVPHSEDIFPSDERLAGAHINDSIAGAVDKTKNAIEEAN